MLSILCSTDNALQISDLEKGGWQMVFRAASGNGDSVYDAWLKGKHISHLFSSSSYYLFSRDKLQY
jgi:hypothetical protein